MAVNNSIKACRLSRLKYSWTGNSSPVLKSEYQNLQIIDLSGYTRQGMIDRAKSEIAIGYALTHLDPFAIAGSDTLYSPHNQNSELDIYDERLVKAR